MKPRKKARAIVLRKKGWSYNEIVKKLKISKSSANYWNLKAIKLSEKAQHRLDLRSINGVRRGIRTQRQRKKEMELKIDERLLDELVLFKCKDILPKILCAIMYACEGAKSNGLTFTNSDPFTIQLYLALLRKTFLINESKLKLKMHLHEYHDEKKQKRFWSRITGIPLSQFNKIYLKPHTGKNKRPGYPGCVQIVYTNHWLVYEMQTVYKLIIQNVVGA